MTIVHVAQATTSAGYCSSRGVLDSSSTGYKNSIFGSHPSCLALTEVANISPHASSHIQVINNHDAVAARYLFVYAEGNTAPSVTVDCMDIPKWD